MNGENRIALAGFIVLLSLLAGCAGTVGGGPVQQDASPPAGLGAATAGQIDALDNRLASLGPGVHPIESRQVAQTAVVYSRTLAARYRVVRPAVWHNILVRMGIRERGLCYHWTADLMRELQALELTSLELRWGVAHRGSELREHNTVVVTARGRPFDTGMVLDPWRNSGRLFWAAVEQDRYPWRELPRNLWF